MVSSDPMIGAHEKWELVHRIAAAALFQKAPRLRKFLLYAAQCSIGDPVGDAREMAIAEHVFGRKPYDAAQDGIVRAEARNLRKRLETYFQTEGKEEPIIVEMPKGGYLLSFRLRDQESSPLFLEEPESACQPALSAPELVEHTMPAARFRATAPIAIAFVVTALSLAYALKTHWAERSNTAGGARTLPFSALFRNSEETTIITSDITLVPGMLTHAQRINLNDYLARTYALPGSFFPPDLAMKGEYTDAQEMSVIGLLLRTYPRAASHILLRSARQIQLSDIKDRNLILLGSAFSNPWTQIFEDRVHFHLEPAENGRGIFVHNSSPHSGELASYPSYDHNQSYAQAAFLPAAAGTGNVLLLAGTTAEATAGAVSFVTNEKEMARALHHMRIAPEGPPHYFELLLRVTTFVGGSTFCEVLTSRDRPPGGTAE